MFCDTHTVKKNRANAYRDGQIDPQNRQFTPIIPQMTTIKPNLRKNPITKVISRI